MKIAVGSDTRCHLTEEIIKHLESKGITVKRYGALAGEETDYVESSHAVAKAVASGTCDQGLLFCNTGTGATLIANKVPGARAALCMDSYSAKIARLANNANIIALGIRLTGEIHAKEIVDTWLNTEPSTVPRRMAFHRKTEEIENLYRRDV